MTRRTLYGFVAAADLAVVAIYSYLAIWYVAVLAAAAGACAAFVAWSSPKRGAR